MKKWQVILLAVLIFGIAAVFTFTVAHAAEVVLPKVIGPHTLAWDDPNPASVNVVGYHVYYRNPGGTWDDTRMATVLAPVKTKNLVEILPASGSYEISISAYSATGESGLSAPIPFTLSIPSSVSNSRIQ